MVRLKMQNMIKALLILLWPKYRELHLVYTVRLFFVFLCFISKYERNNSNRIIKNKNFKYEKCLYNKVLFVRSSKNKFKFQSFD